jgi:hypothetical protein
MLAEHSVPFTDFTREARRSYAQLRCQIQFQLSPEWSATRSWKSDCLTAGHIVSDHTLKHLAAAAAGYCILRMLQKRRPVSLLPSTISIATYENQS